MAPLPLYARAGSGTTLPPMSVITDPLFYLLAIPAITILGIGKGGFPASA